MKKPYVKPALYAESFGLVEHIAGCGAGNASEATVKPYQSAQSCTYTVGTVTVFLDEGIGCDMTYYDSEMYGTNTSKYLSDLQSMYGIECYNAFSTGSAFAS